MPNLQLPHDESFGRIAVIADPVGYPVQVANPNRGGKKGSKNPLASCANRAADLGCSSKPTPWPGLLSR